MDGWLPLLLAREVLVERPDLLHDVERLEADGLERAVRNLDVILGLEPRGQGVGQHKPEPLRGLSRGTPYTSLKTLTTVRLSAASHCACCITLSSLEGSQNFFNLRFLVLKMFTFCWACGGSVTSTSVESTDSITEDGFLWVRSPCASLSTVDEDETEGIVHNQQAHYQGLERLLLVVTSLRHNSSLSRALSNALERTQGHGRASFFGLNTTVMTV